MAPEKSAENRLNLGGRARLLIIGHGRHGKDSVGDLLRDLYGMRAVSSSHFAAQKAVFPLVADLYPDWRAAYEDRANHRDLWFHAIRAYNLRPGKMLAEQILEDHDIYTGMRARAEFDRSREVFDLVIWVDASDRLPPEPGGSMELTADDADLIVDNNGPVGALPGEVEKLAKIIAAAMHLSGGVPGLAGSVAAYLGDGVESRPALAAVLSRWGVTPPNQ